MNTTDAPPPGKSCQMPTTAPSMPNDGSRNADGLVAAFSAILAVAALFQPHVVQGGEGWFPTFAAGEFFLVLAFMGITTLASDRTVVHPYLFFLGTTLLFIGGRFVSMIMGVGTEVPIFNDASYVPVALDGAEAGRLMSLVAAGLLAMHAGYMTARALERWGRLRFPADAPRPELTVPALAVLAIAGVLCVVGIVQHYDACARIGYLGLYQNQGTDNLARAASVGQYGLLLGAGLAFASPCRWLHVLALTMLGGYFAVYLGFGLRSGFLAFVLLATWLIHTRVRRLNILTVAVIPLLMFGLAQLFITTGCRTVAGPAFGLSQTVVLPEGGSDGTEPSLQETMTALRDRVGLSGAAWFAYLQGSTLVYTGLAMRLEDYPREAFAQSFVPGFSRIARIFQPDIGSTSLYFPHFLSYTYSPELYGKGMGIGWNLFADFHAFSAGSPALYLLVAALVGFGFRYVLGASRRSAFFFGALVCIFVKLMLLPRSGLYSVIPYLVVYGFLFAGACLSFRMLAKCRRFFPPERAARSP